MPRPAKPARQTSRSRAATMRHDRTASAHRDALTLRSLPRRLRRPRHGVGPLKRAARSLSVPDPRPQGLGSAKKDELHALAARQTQPLDREAERRELARRGVARARRRAARDRQREDAQPAAPEDTWLVVIDEYERGARREPPREQAQRRLTVRGASGCTQEAHDPRAGGRALRAVA